MPGGSNANGRTGASMIVLAALIELPLVAVLILPNLQRHVNFAIELLLASSLFYMVSVWLILKEPQPWRPSVGLILGAAVVFRLTLWFLPPSLSDDLYRYRWEGKLQAAGGNPYVTAPADPGAAGLRDETYAKVDGKSVRAVYGPLIEIQQHAVYRLLAAAVTGPGRQVFWFKLPSALADLGGIAALLALLRARGLPAERILIYAWSPLAAFEFWGAGHNDAFVVLFLALALAAAARGRDSKAFLWLSLGAAAKLWPAILIPAFTGWRPRRLALAGLILAVVGILCLLPFGAAAFSNRDFTSGFLGGWRNNDSLFGIVLWIARDPYRAKYITFALVAVSGLAISLTRWSIERKTLATTAALLLFASNVHPWYATWLLPALVVETVPAALLFTALVPVFYESVIPWTILGQWAGVSRLRVPVYFSVLLLFLARMLKRNRGNGH